jgi:nitrate/nitrite transport system substrate-binding protein
MEQRHEGLESAGEEQGGNSRRHFITHSGALAASALMGTVAAPVREGAWAAGTDAPEKTALRIGFMPLTDCAPIAVAIEQGFDRKYGLQIVPVKQPSWATVRDGLLNGDLDAAHALYGLIYGVHMGIAGLQRDMAVLMTLNQNGQGITLSSRLRDLGVTDGRALATYVRSHPGELGFAQTFPTGTHAMWLYYWLAAHGIHPFRDVGTTVVPPPQMVARLRAGFIDGCCVGEPWNARAIQEEVGFTAATSQQVWPDHPEKVLSATAAFVERCPNSSRALVMALLEACRYIDTTRNRRQVAELIAGPRYMDTPVDVIAPRFLGDYEDGLGRKWKDDHAIRFHDDGAVNFPYLSDGMWFLTQQRRWGLLKREPDYATVAAQVNRTDLYAQAAAQVGVASPSEPMRISTLIDGAVWNGSAPAQYAAGFDLKMA